MKNKVLVIVILNVLLSFFIFFFSNFVKTKPSSNIEMLSRILENEIEALNIENSILLIDVIKKKSKDQKTFDIVCTCKDGYKLMCVPSKITIVNGGGGGGVIKGKEKEFLLAYLLSTLEENEQNLLKDKISSVSKIDVDKFLSNKSIFNNLEVVDFKEITKEEQLANSIEYLKNNINNLELVNKNKLLNSLDKLDKAKFKNNSGN